MTPIRRVLPLLMVLVTAGCAGLPSLAPISGPGAKALETACDTPFVHRPWRFLHAITVTVAGRRKSGILGLTILRPETRAVRCVVMTIEGLVVFDARDDGTLHVYRALPPFDRPGFARGMINDIRLIFFVPKSPVAALGRLPSGAPVCRYRNPDGSTEDVEVDSAGHWEIRKYDPRGRLSRTVRVLPAIAGAAPGPGGFPRRISLTAEGRLGYALTLELLEAAPVDRDAAAGGKSKDTP